MTDLVELVDGRFAKALRLIEPRPDSETDRVLVCDHAEAAAGLRLCARCGTYLQCFACYDTHVGSAHPGQRCCEVCGEAGAPSLTAAASTVGMNVPVPVQSVDGDWRGRSTLPVTISLVGMICRRDECKRRLAGALHSASELPAVPGSAIRECEWELANKLYGELPAA